METAQGKKQKNRVLFLKLRVDNAHPNKDVAVWINGIRNKLSAKDHVYYNENKIFIYAVPLKDGEDNISVTFGKGKYRLRHVQAYLAVCRNGQNCYISQKSRWTKSRQKIT